MSKHSKAEDLNVLKVQSCVLKVNIHCEGCKKKVKKVLQKIDGVYTIAIDTEQGKVTVTGNMNPATLIKKLNKAGKHAELWSAKKSSNGSIELPHKLPKLADDSAKGSQKPLKSSEGKDQKLQQLQKELKDVKLPFIVDEKSAKFPAFDEEDDDGSEFDDEFDDDDYFDETDGSAEDFDDDEGDVKAINAAPKKIVTVTQAAGGGGGSAAHSKSNGTGGTHGGGKGGGGDGGGGGKNDAKSRGLLGVPAAVGVPTGFFNKGTAAAAATPAVPFQGVPGNAYQLQQNVAEMMQQQRMMMANGHPMAYGYPIPRSESYTDYFSDENTSGGCSVM